MKKFIKTYVGKGKSTPMGIIKVHLLVSELLKFVHPFNEQQYVNIEIARLKAPDNFGRDYTAYVNTLVDVPDKEVSASEAAPVESQAEPLPEQVSEPEKKVRKSSRKAAKVTEDVLPF